MRCPRCGNKIGSLIAYGDGDIELLRMGGGICREWHGICARCKAPLHWSVSEKRLARLIEAVLHSQKK